MKDTIKSAQDKIRGRNDQCETLGRRKRVAIYGGSFDPIHKGHIAVAELVLKSCSFIDEVWFMPCYRNLHGKTLSDPVHRLRMIELAIKNKPLMKASSFEIKRELTSETYYIVKKIFERYEDIEFYFIIGTDNAKIIDMWSSGQPLLSLMRFIVIERPGVEPPENEWYKKHPHIYIKSEKDLYDVSSTHMRNWIKGGGSDHGLLHPDVTAYIKQNKLYK